MAQRKRSTTKSRTRTTARRSTKKGRSRAKKGVGKVTKSMKVTPAQRKRLNQAMRDFEKHINTLTRKYNRILNQIAKF